MTAVIQIYVVMHINIQKINITNLNNLKYMEYVTYILFFRTNLILKS